MNKQFIALIQVNISHYMAGHNHNQEVHLIEATGQDEALVKLEAFYKAKDEPYDVSHTIDILSINELIK